MSKKQPILILKMTAEQLEMLYTGASRGLSHAEGVHLLHEFQRQVIEQIQLKK